MPFSRNRFVGRWKTLAKSWQPTYPSEDRHMHTLLKTLRSYLFPRIQDGFFIGLLVAVSLQGSLLLNADGDLGRHITIGKYIAKNWMIPTRDIFSHTMTGERLVPHEWLSQLSLGAAHAAMGLRGDVLLIAILIATTFTLTYREMLRRNVFRIVALVIAILAASTSMLHWSARPHIFTFLFVALWTYQLENQSSKVWLFPLIMLVWANTHGAFIAGFVIWGAHMAGWVWDFLQRQSTKVTARKLLVIGAGSLAVTFINPAGWQLWKTSVGYFGSQFLVDQTLEYQSPNFHNWSTWPFLAMLGLSLIALNAKGRLQIREALLLTGWTLLSLYSARNIPLFAIIAAPYIGQLLHSAMERIVILNRIDQIIMGVEANLRGILYPVLTIVLLAGTSLDQPQPTTANQFNEARFPVKAIDWLEANPQDGNMFNNFIWGGYILYRMWPQELVFIDGQTDFYGETLTREYVQVMSLQGDWPAVLEKYGVSWVIVQSDKPLVDALFAQLHWKIVYRDGTATILHNP
jgi:hypothetical protein